MRIAVIANAYPPTARGGAGRIAALQVELLRGQGHEVRVWTASLAWTQRSFVRRLFSHLRDLVWAHPCVDEVISWKPDAVLSHNLTGVGFRTPRTIRARLLQRSGVVTRWVHVLHDVQLFHPVGLLADESQVTWLQRVVTGMRKGVFGLPDAVVSPTDWLLQAHLRRGWFHATDTVVLPNPAPERAPLDERSWQEPLRALFVGRVCPEKGSELLKTLIQQTTRPMAWRVIGPESETLKGLNVPVTARVTLDGPSSSETILQAMREADVLLVPSQVVENQPTVLLEAFAMGLPVIGQALGGIPETIGTAGVCVASSDPATWSDALARLTREPRAYWSARVREAWEAHAPERVVEALLEVLKSNKKI